MAIYPQETTVAENLGVDTLAVRVRSTMILKSAGADASPEEVLQFYAALTAAAADLGRRYVASGEPDAMAHLRAARKFARRALADESKPVDMEKWLAAQPGLGVRALNAIQNAGVKSPAELAEWVCGPGTKTVRNFGRKSRTEILTALGIGPEPASVAAAKRAMQAERKALAAEIQRTLEAAVSAWEPGAEKDISHALLDLGRTPWRLFGEGPTARWARAVPVSGPLWPWEVKRAEEDGLHVFQRTNEADGQRYPCIGEVTERGSDMPGMELGIRAAG